MGKTKYRIILSEEERKTLELWINSGKTEHRLVQRATVVLNASKGLTLEEISQKVGLTKANCANWKKEYYFHGINGLKDKKRQGRPLIYTAEQRCNIISIACSKTEDGSNHWSTRKIAKKTGMSKSTISKILRSAAIKPHKTVYWCGKSTDPEFEAKQTAILGLYLNPPENALVISVDEKSQIQALDRTQPMLPLKSKYPKRMTATYKRNGTTCLLAALVVHEGKVVSKCIDRHTHKEFLNFLKYLYRKFPHKELHVIMDNYAAHKHSEIIEWASHRRRLFIYYTPTYSSWLNQIEIWFNIFTRDVIKNGIWKSKKELVDQIMLYVRKYNEEGHLPFKWNFDGKPLTI